jgi:DNA/RNA-binding domain of Phe-tRNA-synthetase-like protein
MHGLPERFEHALRDLLERRAGSLEADEEHVRKAARELLRNGRYRPSGRGKPASEYLLRAAGAPESFPRINAPVDICNYISLKYLVPVSLWDVDLASTETFSFRLGRPDESYVFNTAGQRIDLEDLLVGCAVMGEEEVAIVNPVKDSLLAKTTPDTTRVAAAVYAPSPPVSENQLIGICEEFASLLGACAARTGYAVAAPGEERAVQVRV